MNYYPHHIGDYASATAHLSMLEDCAYRRLLDWYDLDEKAIPTEKRAVYRRVRAQSEEEREAVDEVLLEFFTRTDDGYTHKRCEEELARARDKSEKARQSAHASVAARSAKAGSKPGGGHGGGGTGGASSIRKDRIEAARAKGTHSEEEWQRLKRFTGYRCVRCGCGEPVQKDHILPIYQGGSDAIGNLQPLCRTCNTSKGPEAIDHRPPGWAEFVCFAERTANERSGFLSERSNSGSERLAPNSQEPITKSQEEPPIPPAAAAADPVDPPTEGQLTLPGTTAKVLQLPAVQPGEPPGFTAFWMAYPNTGRKVGKAKCRDVWGAKKLEPMGQAIAAHVTAMRQTDKWRDGFEPKPETYLNQGRYEDPVPPNGPRNASRRQLEELLQGGDDDDDKQAGSARIAGRHEGVLRGELRQEVGRLRNSRTGEDLDGEDGGGRDPVRNGSATHDRVAGTAIVARGDHGAEADPDEACYGRTCRSLADLGRP